jgi:hypothetical protein
MEGGRKDSGKKKAKGEGWRKDGGRMEGVWGKARKMKGEGRNKGRRREDGKG